MPSNPLLRTRVMLAAATLGAASSGCPTPRGETDGRKVAESAAAAPTPTHVAPQPAPAPAGSLAADEGGEAALSPGMALTGDVAHREGDAWGVELVFEVRPRYESSPPTQFGANVATVADAQRAAIGVLRVILADGRMRIRFGPHAFALSEGSELRAERARKGEIYLPPASTHAAVAYRVVPVGALRSLLADRRIDVLPLASTRVGRVDTTTRLGRHTERVVVSTAYGTLYIEQIIAPVPPRGFAAAPPRDARAGGPSSAASAASPESRVTGVDGAGEPLCRAMVELVDSDRALGGKPCDGDRIPVWVEVAFARGGGVVLEATSIREGAIPRVDLAFPPADASLATSSPDIDDGRLFLDAATLLGFRTKGDPTSVDLANYTPQPRVALVDGVPIGWLAPGRRRSIGLRRGRYVIEWRTPLGEVAERAVELEAPGRSTIGQSPASSPSSATNASPMPSARTGP